MSNAALWKEWLRKVQSGCLELSNCSYETLSFHWNYFYFSHILIIVKSYGEAL